MISVPFCVNKKDKLKCMDEVLRKNINNNINKYIYLNAHYFFMVMAIYKIN